MQYLGMQSLSTGRTAGRLGSCADRAITDENADRLRSLLGQAKGKGWSKEAFFSVFTEDYIAQVFTIKDPDTMGTPAEILQFYKDNWDDCPPIYE